MVVWRRLLDREASDRGRGEGATGRASKAWALGEAGRQRQGGPRAGAAVLSVLVVVVASFLRSANRGRHEHDVPVSGWLHARGGKPARENARRSKPSRRRSTAVELVPAGRRHARLLSLEIQHYFLRPRSASTTVQPGDPAYYLRRNH
jgi:hypothetical protein